jgi:DNA segregation ATPase FtsK/SpoIIIE, S-DNA-T family
MTSTNDDRDPVDWERYETEIGNTDSADVLDLDKARQRRDTTDPYDGADLDPNITGVVLVDSVAAQRRPRFTLTGLRDAKRQRIVPGWLRSSTEFAGNLVWAAGLAGHTAGYHGFRLPKYTAKMAWRAPRGAARLISSYVRWLFDLEGVPYRQATARTEDADTYLKLARQRDRRVRWRGIATVPIAVCLVLAAGWLATADTMTVSATLAVLVGVCGIVGTPADKPLLDTAVVRTDAAPLTSAEVVRALATLRIVGIDRAIRAGDTGKRWFPAPIVRDNGTGWRAEVELPRGVTATEVVEKREELASALARPLGCVWPEANADVHPGRLVLFVADKDMSRSKQSVWPLLKSGTVDLFTPFPFGTDPRGRLVTLTLMFASMIIGSIPRMGKTFSLRLALLGAALDPRAWLFAFDFKGTGDLSPLEPVCHRYRAGDDDEDVEYVVIAMREVRAELRRRTKVIRQLPRDLCPENKVTPELANRKTLGLHPVVIGIDECQVGFEHPKYGAELEEICTDLVKRGPAAGMTLVLATQRPDAKSLPTGISANAVLRFCLKVMGHLENDMVLGTSMHKTGIRATMFSRRDRGIGYLAGEGDDPQIARTFYIDGPTAETIVTRARAARERAGTLTGHAAGHTVDTTTVRRDTLLDDVAIVLGAGEPKVWTEIVVDRLAGLRPHTYTGMTREELTAALKTFGVKTKQIWGTDPVSGEGANRRGIDRTDILTAITHRDGNQGGKAAS